MDVHLILLRKQRLMQNSAFSFPRAGDTKLGKPNFHNPTHGDANKPKIKSQNV